MPIKNASISFGPSNKIESGKEHQKNSPDAQRQEKVAGALKKHPKAAGEARSEVTKAVKTIIPKRAMKPTKGNKILIERRVDQLKQETPQESATPPQKVNMNERNAPKAKGTASTGILLDGDTIPVGATPLPKREGISAIPSGGLYGDHTEETEEGGTSFMPPQDGSNPNRVHTGEIIVD